MMRAAVFLDRDGVINRAAVCDGTPQTVTAAAELQILPGVAAALQALSARSYPLIVVTNQPEVARGNLSAQAVEEIHARLRAQLPLDAIFTCFHDDADGCDCRKPRPGLLLRAADEFGLDLPASYMVGDRWRDVEAGRRAGCRTVFVDQAYAEAAPLVYDFRVGSLPEAAAVILSNPEPR